MAVNSWRGDLTPRGGNGSGGPPPPYPPPHAPACGGELVGWVERKRNPSTPAVGFAQPTLRSPRAEEGRVGRDAAAGFWRQLHNPVTSPYKVEGRCFGRCASRVSGPGCLDEVEERRRERSCST